MTYSPRSVFKPGDIVTLKSGGPHMTVSTYPNSAGVMECIWFVELEIRVANFRDSAVVHVSWFRRFFGL